MHQSVKVSNFLAYSVQLLVDIIKLRQEPVMYVPKLATAHFDAGDVIPEGVATLAKLRAAGGEFALLGRSDFSVLVFGGVTFRVNTGVWSRAVAAAVVRSSRHTSQPVKSRARGHTGETARYPATFPAPAHSTDCSTAS